MTGKIEITPEDGRWILTDEWGGTWELRNAADPEVPFYIVPLTRSDAWRKLKGPYCTLNHEGPCNIACGDHYGL